MAERRPYVFTRTEGSKFHIARRQNPHRLTEMLCGWVPPLWVAQEVAVEDKVDRAEACSRCLKIAESKQDGGES